MGYVGDKLAPLFDPLPAEIAARRLAEAGGDAMHEHTVRNTPIDMGNLRSGWYTTPVERTRHRGARAWTVWVRTEVEYAPHVEWGTGIYGPSGSPYPIPREGTMPPGRWMTWVDRGTGERIWARRVMHPGSPGAHMLAIGVAMTEHTFVTVGRPVLEQWRYDQEAAARNQ